MAWYGRMLKSNILAAIQYYVEKEYKKDYPNISFGTDYLSKTEPKLPYIRLYRSDGRTTAPTFDGIVGIVDQTYNIDVFSNKSESLCEEISELICEKLSKNMVVIREPFPNYSDTTEYRVTTQVQWVVGGNNIIKW